MARQDFDKNITEMFGVLPELLTGGITAPQDFLSLLYTSNLPTPPAVPPHDSYLPPIPKYDEELRNTSDPDMAADSAFNRAISQVGGDLEQNMIDILASSQGKARTAAGLLPTTPMERDHPAVQALTQALGTEFGVSTDAIKKEQNSMIQGVEDRTIEQVLDELPQEEQQMLSEFLENVNIEKKPELGRMSEDPRQQVMYEPGKMQSSPPPFEQQQVITDKAATAAGVNIPSDTSVTLQDPIERQDLPPTDWHQAVQNIGTDDYAKYVNMGGMATRQDWIDRGTIDGVKSSRIMPHTGLPANYDQLDQQAQTEWLNSLDLPANYFGLPIDMRMKLLGGIGLDEVVDPRTTDFSPDMAIKTSGNGGMAATVPPTTMTATGGVAPTSPYITDLGTIQSLADAPSPDVWSAFRAHQLGRRADNPDLWRSRFYGYNPALQDYTAQQATAPFSKEMTFAEFLAHENPFNIDRGQLLQQLADISRKGEASVVPSPSDLAVDPYTGLIPDDTRKLYELLTAGDEADRKRDTINLLASALNIREGLGANVWRSAQGRAYDVHRAREQAGMAAPGSFIASQFGTAS
jgi:hypothetical protein